MSSADSATTDHLEWLTELGLISLTGAVAIGFGRLFSDGSLVMPFVLATIAAHVSAWGLRRLGAGKILTVLGAVVTLVIFLAVVIEPSTTTFGLPLRETWRTVWDDLDRARSIFFELRAPVEPERGFALACIAAIWAAAFVSDWLAFRLRRAYEALIPTMVVLIFSAIEGPRSNRIAAMMLYLVAALAFLLLHSNLRRSASLAWPGNGLTAGPRAVLRGGAAISGVAILAGLTFGVILPGAGNHPIVDWHKEPPPDPRLEVSPLVDIQKRLVSQADTQVFVVQSPLPSYWRLTSLSDFDGEQWRSDGIYRKTKPKLTETVPIKRQGTKINQFFTISSLSSIWLPAAYRPDKLGDVQLVSPDIDQLLLDPSGNALSSPAPVGIRYNSDNASLLTKNPTSDNLNYRVESSIPFVDAEGLAKASSRVPREIADSNLTLPPNFPEQVRTLAKTVTRGQTTPYAKARALQDYFRNNFKYSVDVEPGHSDAAMVRFLFTDKAGYCEQFAGTYAAMARAIGLPARVAVGFTPGEFRNGSFVVTGRQAHAWPEVWVNGYGWVAFEPTPGRGLPNDAQQYTGVPSQQDVLSTGTPLQQITTPVTQVTTPTTAAPTQQTTPDQKANNQNTEGTDAVQTSLTWARRVAVVLLSIVAAFLLWATGLQLTFAAMRRRRRRAATSPTDRTLLAWDETLDELRSVGVHQQDSETPSEYARRAEATTRVDSNLLAGLATNVTTATFCPTGVELNIAEQSEVAAATIASIMNARRSAKAKVVRVIDPRPLARR